MPPRKKLPTDPELNHLRTQVIDLRQTVTIHIGEIKRTREMMERLSLYVSERIDGSDRRFNIVNETVKAVAAAQIPDQITGLRQELAELKHNVAQIVEQRGEQIHELEARITELENRDVEHIHQLETRINILTEELKALRNGMPVSQDNTSRLRDLEQRIVVLEDRNPPGPSVRARVLNIEEAVNIMEARLSDLENADLLTHQRLHSLEGGKGLEPPQEPVKGGWLNIYGTLEDGVTPDMTSTTGPFRSWAEADDEARGRHAIKRIARLYLQGEEDAQ